MNNAVGLILSAALIADTIANLLRLRGVKRAIRQQAEMMRQSDIEAEKRIDAASKVVEDVVKMTVAEILSEKT
jgi:lipopolysaccharide biosynthesis regulator YciM